MNKTLLLMLIDFLLLHIIHDSPWTKVDKHDARAGGGTQTYAQHADELQFVRLRLREEQKDRESVQQQLAFTRSSDADRQKKFADLQQKLKTAQESSSISTEAQKEIDRQRLVALKDANDRRELLETKVREIVEGQKHMSGLTNEVRLLSEKTVKLEGENRVLVGDRSRLESDNNRLKGDNTRLADSNNLAQTQIGDLKVNLTASNTKLGNALSQADGLDKANKTLTGQLGQAQTQIGDLRVNLTASNTKLGNALSQADGLNQQLTAEKQNSAGLQGSLTKSQTDLASESTRRTGAEASFVREVKVNESLRTEIKKTLDSTEAMSIAARQKLEDLARAQPISPNRLFTEFLPNRVKLQMQLSRTKPVVVFQGNKPVELPREVNGVAQPVLVEGSQYLYALIHVNDSPFQFGNGAAGWEKASGAFVGRTPQQQVPVAWLGFIKDEPRVIVVPLHKGSKAVLGVNKPYSLAKEPEKYAEALIIHKGQDYGVVEFKVDPKKPNYVRMDKPLLGGLFSRKFNPSEGDIVLSRAGELLGIMVNDKYCLVLREGVLDDTKNGYSDFVVFNDKTSIGTISSKLQSFSQAIQRKPGDLQ